MADVQLAVCAEMVFTDLPLIDRPKFPPACVYAPLKFTDVSRVGERRRLLPNHPAANRTGRP